jgi:hypothetical protein
VNKVALASKDHAIADTEGFRLSAPSQHPRLGLRVLPPMLLLINANKYPITN